MSGRRRGTDRSHHGRFLRRDLVRNLSTVNLNMPRKVEGDADALALDRRDPNDPDGVPRISDDDFLSLASRNHQHETTPWLVSPARAKSFLGVPNTLARIPISMFDRLHHEAILEPPS